MAYEKHFTPPPGVQVGAYTAAHDRIYRMFLLLMPVGILLVAVGQLAGAPVWRLGGVALWDLGLLGAAYMLMVWDQRVKQVILGAAVVGVLLQLAAMAGDAAVLVPLGAGVAAVGASGIAKKEDFCFNIWQGRVLPWGYALAVLVFLFGLARRSPLAGDAVMLLLLYLAASFTWRKLRLPLVVVDGNCG